MAKRKPQEVPSHTSKGEAVNPLQRWAVALLPIVAIALFVGLVAWIADTGRESVFHELFVDAMIVSAWLASAYGWGSLLRGLAKIQGRDALIRVSTLAVGLGLISIAVLLLGLAGLMGQITASLIIVGGCVPIIINLWRKRKTTLVLEAIGERWIWLCMIPILSLTVVSACLPAGLLWGESEPNGYDVVEYHLQVPREWFEAGKISGLQHNVFSYFPFSIETHYLLGMHLVGSPWDAQFLSQLMHAAFIALTVAAIYASCRERGRGPALVAALLAASCPWLPMLGAIAYNEGGYLLFSTLAIAWMLRADLRDYPIRNALIAGAMAGFACGCKLTAIPILCIALPLGVLLVQFIGAGVSRRLLFAAATLPLLAAVVMSPWLIRNAAWTGNPVFPEQQALLGRGHFTQVQADRYYVAHKPTIKQQTLLSRLDAFWLQVLRDWRFGFVLVPVGLLAMAATLRRTQSQLLAILLISLTLFWLGATHLQGRFFVLAIPICAMAVAQINHSIVRRALLVIAGVGCIACFIHTYRALEDFRGRLASRFGIDVMQIAATNAINSADKLAPAGMPLVLVGDAAAFHYQLPKGELYYRTAFDAVGPDAVTAWTAAVPADRDVFLWVNPSELARLSKSYGTPAYADGPSDPSQPPFGKIRRAKTP